MELFKLVRDDRVIGWTRSYYEVNANSLDEAVRMVKNEDVDPMSSEYLYGSEELVDPGFIDNNPTIEIFDGSIDNILWHN